MSSYFCVCMVVHLWVFIMYSWAYIVAFLIYKCSILVPHDSFWLSHTKVSTIIKNFLSNSWHLSNTMKISAWSTLKEEITSYIEVWKAQVQEKTYFLKFRFCFVCTFISASFPPPHTRISEAPIVGYFAVIEFKTLWGWNWKIEISMWLTDLFLWLTMWF